MSEPREIHSVSKALQTTEGAGVRLKRAFSKVDSKLDPFLLLDDFHSDNPNDYIKGFPWHPHRGIETITYMLNGQVYHGDSLGNEGVIGPGDVQWMTAGSGIIHQEMPHQQNGELWGFQLWANLPSANKMMSPRYQDIPKDSIPLINPEPGVRIRVICGQVYDTQGPVKDIVTDPMYMDIEMFPSKTFSYSLPEDYNVFSYVVSGKAIFGSKANDLIESESLVVFGDGQSVRVETLDQAVRFLLVGGKPIGEPVSWDGPIVMNTQEELTKAFSEYEAGTFIKDK